MTYRDLLVQNPINCSSVVIRKDVAAEFPMVHDECHEDYIMWLQILKKYRKACAINKPLLNYRLSNTGKSGSKLQSARMTFKVYRYMNFGYFKSLMCFVGYAFFSFFSLFMSQSVEKNSIYSIRALQEAKP